ncbi:hypothetical protein [Pectobacterium versatile]|uniref:hypothetical protein n=1 Tax=Pectobacterium versatile TaxID=2488639 RepID=UPI002B2554F1|nr:hypothetical protein [Pectobacterium versatile]
MDKKLFRRMFEMHIKKEFGENASFATYEYVHLRKYRKHRVGGRVLGGGPEGKTQLYAIVHQLLTDEERIKVFPGTFDLGNFREIRTELCKYAVLEKEIYNESCTDAHDVLRTIKKRTGELLGKEFCVFFEENKSKSLKVLKTLYRFQREYKTLFTLLTPPQKSHKPSYEIRDAYGIDAACEEVEIISDLKSHLSFEIPSERLQSITSTYGQLRSVLDGIEDMLIQQAVSMCDNSQIKFLAIVDYMSTCAENILKFEGRETVQLPLDESFFIYLMQLEFYHHVEANVHVFDAVTTTPLPFVESLREIGNLMHDIGFENKSAQYLKRSIEQLKNDFISCAEIFIPFYCNLLNREIVTNTYFESIPLFEKLLKVFSHAGVQKEITFTIAISAMALVLVELHKSTPYRPFWYGQHNISGGLVEFLNNISLDHINLNSPEGSARYWTGRLEYFSYAIIGQARTYEASLKFNRCINNSIMRILDTQDTALLDEKLSLFVSTNGGTVL